MGMTIIEKIFARNAGKDSVHPGQFLDAKVDRIIAHEEFYRIHTACEQNGVPGIPRIFDLDRFHVVLEHFQPAIDGTQALRAIKMRELAERYGLKHFRNTLAGVLHRIVAEDYVVPGELALGSDSHSCAWGALNCAGTGMGEHELAFALTFGELWFQVPETIKVVLEGEWNPSITGKDVALWLAGRYTTTFGLYKSIEFTGPGAAAMSIEQRFQLSTHAVELGAKFGLFDYDRKTEAFLAKRTILREQLDRAQPVAADPDAHYCQTVHIDLDNLLPQVAKPHTFENVVPVTEVAGVHIDQALVGSCANGHLEDIEAVASVLKGRKVDPRVRFFVQPNSLGRLARSFGARLLRCHSGFRRPDHLAGLSPLPGHAGPLGRRRDLPDLHHAQPQGAHGERQCTDLSRQPDDRRGFGDRGRHRRSPRDPRP